MLEHWLPQHSRSTQEVIEILELYQLAHEFRQEQVYREAWESSCQRYAELAAQHQQEHAMMQAELNLFRLFCRTRSES